MIETAVPTILIVDDDPVNLEVLTNVLKPQGYRILQAINGARAVGIVQHVIPDLVMMDVQMPGQDGFETCRQLRKIDAMRDIPVLFVSGQQDFGEKLKGFQAGGVDYIDKPFNHDELLARVDTHLALKAARERLRRTNEEIDTLLHVLSHDLMNPIAAVKGFVRLAQRLPAYQDRQNREYWELVEAAVRQMEQIIDHVRAMQALDSGKIRVALTAVSLTDVIRSARTVLQTKLESKGVNLVIDLGGESEAIRVLAEPLSLTHNVITNLLSNAIKFSYRGSEITLDASREADRVHVRITDHGIGIPENLMRVLFRPDRPTTRPGTENELGTGFGMPLVKKYVDSFGGSIEVESRAAADSPTDHGTTVHLYLRSGETREASGAA